MDSVKTCPSRNEINQAAMPMLELLVKHYALSDYAVIRLGDVEIVSHKKALADHCGWKQNGASTGDTVWDTGCGRTFAITGGAPEKNEMKYCCYCGKRLKLDCAVDGSANA